MSSLLWENQEKVREKWAKFAYTASDDKDYQVDFYN